MQCLSLPRRSENSLTLDQHQPHFQECSAGSHRDLLQRKHSARSSSRTVRHHSSWPYQPKLSRTSQPSWIASPRRLLPRRLKIALDTAFCGAQATPVEAILDLCAIEVHTGRLRSLRLRLELEVVPSIDTMLSNSAQPFCASVTSMRLWVVPKFGTVNDSLATSLLSCSMTRSSPEEITWRMCLAKDMRMSEDFINIKLLH